MTVANNVSFEESLEDFSFSLYQDIYKADNICLSPFSLSATLLLLILGTSGQSKSQLQSVLFRNGYPAGDIEKKYKSLHNDLKGRARDIPGMQLSIANQLFVGKQHVHRILYKFRKEAKYDFGCHVGLMDFGHEPYTRNVINKWIERKTRRKIKNFIPNGMLNDFTFMVLTNVIYFKGEWESKFDARRTRKRDFWITKNSTTSTDMMYKKFKVKSAEDKTLDCKAIELPYNGGNISMVVILPNEKDGLPLLEKNLSFTVFDSLIKKLYEQETEVILPKFKVSANFDLKLILSKLGVSDIFDSTKADFSHMVRPHDQYGELYVSNAIHESMIEVNEEGSEATAATSFVISFRSALPKAFKFTADHPFLFVIRDMNSGTILFIGRYSNPDMEQTQHYKVPKFPPNDADKPDTAASGSPHINSSENQKDNSTGSKQKIESTDYGTTDTTPKAKTPETKSSGNKYQANTNIPVIKENFSKEDSANKYKTKSSEIPNFNVKDITNTNNTTSNKHDDDIFNVTHDGEYEHQTVITSSDSYGVYKHPDTTDFIPESEISKNRYNPSVVQQPHLTQRNEKINESPLSNSIWKPQSQYN